MTERNQVESRSALPLVVTMLVLVTLGLVAFRRSPIHAMHAPQEAAPSQIIVSASWVEEAMRAPDVVLLHVAYEAPRRLIAGAGFLDYDEIALPVDGGLRVELPSPDDLARALGEVGVSNETRVILYGEGAPHLAARAFVAFDYIGHGSMTSVLDGGLQAWIASGRATDTAPAAAAGSTFVPRARDDMLVDAGWIRARLDDPAVTLVDARPVEEYTGQLPQEGLRGGHIPGAYNMYYMDLVQPDGPPTLLPIDDVAARFRDAGAEAGGTVVNYCYIGMRASYTYLVARHLGYDARFYDGSWDEWGRGQDFPVVGGSSPR
jgi:thiosulfate/3-mercaptopyruvate sulfurtransferase